MLKTTCFCRDLSIHAFFILTIALCLSSVSSIGDTLLLKTGSKFRGTVLQTNNGDLVVMTETAVYNFSESNIKSVKAEPLMLPERQGDKRLPSLQETILALAKQPWGTNLTQIPATVIDKGVFRNVPYVSFRCGSDFEVNVYGDLNAPAAIEAGVYRSLLSDGNAKRGCMEFVARLLGERDRELVRSLNLEKDLKSLDGYTFEVTPATDEDAYGGWWISAFSEVQMDRSRASENEMEKITIPKASSTTNASTWTADEMKLARVTQPDIITVIDSSGRAITNAEVVRVVDSAYVIWRSPDQGMGMTKLESLSEEVRTRYGYDSAKAAIAYRAEEKRKAAAAAPAPQVVHRDTQVAGSIARGKEAPSYYSSYEGYSTPTRSSGGSVYVKGYYRKDGTYVHAHTRRSRR